MQRGLLKEIIALGEMGSSPTVMTAHDKVLVTQPDDSTADYTTGIYQSIGTNNCYSVFLCLFIERNTCQVTRSSTNTFPHRTVQKRPSMMPWRT